MPTPDAIAADTAPLEADLEQRIASLFLLQGDAAIQKLERIQALFDDLPNTTQAAALLDPALSVQMADLIQSGAETAYGTATEAMSAELRLGISFDLAHPRAVAFLKDYGANQVKLIDGTTKDDIRRLLVTASDEGWSYTRLARGIRTLHEGYTKRRSELIAITELGNAYQEGLLATVKDASTLGLKFEKNWYNSGDNRVTAGCIANTAAGWIGLDEAFPSGHQRPVRFPGCRCALQMRRQK
jgi:hypothetical protein